MQKQKVSDFVTIHDEQKLIPIFRKLDSLGRKFVLSRATEELRRVEQIKFKRK